MRTALVCLLLATSLRAFDRTLDPDALQQAIALGGPIVEISPDEARRYAASDNYSRAWELWRKKALR